jgi:membrane associated rhomboid family serine protease
MVQASVGYHCPECVKGQGQRTITAGQLRVDPIATKVLIALNVLTYLVVAVAGGARTLWELPGSELADRLVLIGAAPGPAIGPDPRALPGLGVAEGEWWRLVTGGFLHAGVLHLGMNMLLLWLLGQMLEPALGRPRFVAIYVASLLGGSMGVMLVDPTSATVGASGAIFGLMGAAVALQRSRGVNPWQSGLGGLILINVLITFGVPGISVGGHIGGLLGGALAGLAVFELEKRTDSTWSAVAACAGLTVVYAVLAVWASQRWFDPVLGFLTFW